MYSFGPLPRQKRSGRIIGTHQKIDRIARRHLASHLKRDGDFPSITDILHFEGSRGPDGIKLKSPGRDEPEHFIDPKNITKDAELLIAIRGHRENLIQALVAKNDARAAFEAAWLAHAVGDGLTPAHHDSYHAQLETIGKGRGDKRTKVSSKIVMSGEGSSKEFLKNNWKYWGAKGVLTTHTLFEAGMATAAKPLRFRKAQLTNADIAALERNGFEVVYVRMVHQIASLNMYENFKKRGWTHDIAQQTTQQLLPTVVTATVLAWYDAYMEAEKRSNP